MTKQVFQNNHWDLAENIWSAAGGNRFAKPVAIPEKIGDPSKIKHVFLIIRENRTYDQMLGDVAGGNGDPTLAVFGDNSTYAAYPVVTPNAHTLVQRFPLLDNFYDPSRQSADGHNWITPGHGALLRRHPVAGLAPRLSLQRRRCDRLPEEGPPVGRGCGRRHQR
jgi:hypothetical protein